MLAVGILWSLFTLYAVAMFLPPLNRRLREWNDRLHPTSRAPTYPQRILFLLLTLLMTAVSMSAAFHRDLLATIGISSGMACSLMMILQTFYFAMGWLKKPRKGGQQPRRRRVVDPVAERHALDRRSSFQKLFEEELHLRFQRTPGVVLREQLQTRHCRARYEASRALPTWSSS